MTKYVELKRILEYPIRRDYYDRENGNEHFINGIESVMEYIEMLPTIEVETLHGEIIVDDYQVECAFDSITTCLMRKFVEWFEKNKQLETQVCDYPLMEHKKLVKGRMTVVLRCEDKLCVRDEQ